MNIPELKRFTLSESELKRAKTQFKERLLRIENKYKVEILVNLKTKVVIRK